MNRHVREQDSFTHIIEFTPGMRKLVGDAVEALVLLLDEIDGDENLEEEPDLELGLDDEPSLGSLNATDQSGWARTFHFEFCIDGEKEADDEPTMGATENHATRLTRVTPGYPRVDFHCSQEKWAGEAGQASNDECEEENVGEQGYRGWDGGPPKPENGGHA